MQSAKALAKATGYTPRRIAQMAAKGQIVGAVKDDGGRWQFPPGAVVWKEPPRPYKRK